MAVFNAKDVDAIMATYGPDEALFVFDVVPPLQYNGVRKLTTALSGRRSACQTPERSGLPLTRGAGAVRFGLPSLV